MRPVSLKEGNRLVGLWHSHHKRVRIHKFCIGAFVDDAEVGVVIVGTPVAQALNNGTTFEVTRLCTNGSPNAASRLLGAAWKASKAMGVKRLVSYTRKDEAGTSYLAAGWRRTAKVKGREWTSGNKANRWLPGMYEPATEIVDRVRWEQAAEGHKTFEH